MISFIIPLPPRTKKNSHQLRKNRKTGKLYPAPSKAFEQYQKDAGWYIPMRGAMIGRPVNIRCLFYMSTNGRVDLTNLLEAIDDILVHYKVLVDDNSKIVIGHDGSRVYTDRESPRTEIEIQEV
jgi:Holliday junction resolvase RusA-like endonuclease